MLDFSQGVDELPEFHKNVLEVFRQLLEDGLVTLGRAKMTLTYLARFMLPQPRTLGGSFCRKNHTTNYNYLVLAIACQRI